MGRGARRTVTNGLASATATLGRLLVIGGCIALLRDIAAWLGYGGRIDLSITTVAQLTTPLLSDLAAAPADWIADLLRVMPLSFTLIALGWSVRQAALATLDVRRDRSPSR